ncbi:MAG: sensor histidine kinase [Pseudomonadota bacterium]
MLIRSLSGRLLLLTVLFVMLAEVLIFVPSIARFREDYLSERLERAQIASLAVLAAPGDMVTGELERELLATAEVLNIVLRRDVVRELVLSGLMPGPIDATYDLRQAGAWELVRDAFACLLAPPGRIIRVIGTPAEGGGVAIEATLEEDRLRAAMLAYGLRVLALSLVISAITAGLIAMSLRRFLVRPMTRVIDNMRAFAQDPEDASRVIRPSSGISEIAQAESALERLETEIRGALRQRARLAAMGEALAKVAHDLRNLLSTAQLLADRLEGSEDPRVARVGPKIVRSLDRAAALCASTLDYGRVEEPRPVIRRVALRALAGEVGESVFPDRGDGEGTVRFVNAVPEGMEAPADPDHLHRILANLARNARQAMEGAGRAGEVRLSAEREGDEVILEVSDEGPGLPEQARANLFTPFKGGARRGGAGLGLAIAAELARGHGGAVELARSTTEGSVFRVRLPARAAEDAA